MPRTTTADALQNIDRRLTNVEQILPTLPTRDEMHAAIKSSIAEAIAPLATREGMRAEGELTRHHFNVVAERLESQIQVIIEGFGALNERVTVVQLASEDRDASLDRRVMHLEARARG